MSQNETQQYDLFSQMTLEELIQNEKAALSFLSSSSDFLAKQAKKDLSLIRQVMHAVHSYNWLTKQVRVS